jgi:hypothetical protein
MGSAAAGERIMDVAKLSARVKAILLTPKAEWPVIAAEPATVASLYTDYILLLAAIPAVCSFIKSTMIGYGVPLLSGTYRLGIGSGLTTAITTYVFTLVGVFIVALIVEALAPTFGGEKNRVQALKVVAYAYTSSWIAGIAYLIPGLSFLILLAGAIYGIYLLYLGLPPTMKCPPAKAAGYTALTFVVAIVLSWIIAYAVASVGGPGRFGGFGRFQSATGSPAAVTFDRNSAAGQLQQWAAGVEAANKRAEVAQKSGDPQAAAAAAGGVLAAAIGGGAKVEALAPDRLKVFLPDTLGGLKRSTASAERNGALGMQVAEAKAHYQDDSGRGLDLDIIDLGSARGLAAFASWAGTESEKETETGYEKTYKQGDRLIHERWDSSGKNGEYGAVLAERFSVKVAGAASGIEELKSDFGSLNLSGLEALRSEGVQSN